MEFIYQEKETKMTEPIARENHPLVPLTPQTLSQMPSQWLRELERAASLLKGKLVLKLIADIEPEHPDLARQLRDLAQNYQFKQIIELISQI